MILTFYKKIKYYLKKNIRIKYKLKNKKKLFNFRYFFLRNVIERNFDVFKRRFKIIRMTFEFSIFVQIRLIYALINFNNFIAKYNRKSN